MLRIGIVTPGFSENERDWFIPALLNFVKSLSRHAEVEVFSLHYPYKKCEYNVFGSTVHSLGGSRGRGFRRARLFLRAIFSIVRQHRRTPFNIFHSMWAGEAALVARVAGKLLRVPVVVTVMGGELVGIRGINYGLQLRMLSRIAVWLSLRLANAVTVGSRHMYDLCARYLHRHGKVELVPFGADAELFSPGKKHHDQSVKKLLSVGSLIPVKNHSLLLHSIARLAKSSSHVRLTIVGSGPLERELKDLSNALHISDLVTFVGHVVHDKLPDYYREADVLVLPSLHEGQGMVAIEALACGVPVVGSAVGVLPDLPENVCTLVKTGDPDGLTDALRTVLTRTDLQENGDDFIRETILNRYTVQKSVEAFLELYGQVKWLAISRETSHISRSI